MKIEWFEVSVDNAMMGATTTLRFKKLAYTTSFSTTQQFVFVPMIDMTNLLSNTKVNTPVLCIYNS